MALSTKGGGARTEGISSGDAGYANWDEVHARFADDDARRSLELDRELVADREEFVASGMVKKCGACHRDVHVGSPWIRYGSCNRMKCRERLGAPTTNERDTRRASVVEFVRNMLLLGPVDSRRIWGSARAHGIDDRDLRWAAAHLGVIRRRGRGMPWKMP